MSIITQLFDFIIHIDKHLAVIIQDYGAWTYLILFCIIFGETGLVVTPFLPGDSLLFVIGALGSTGALDFKLTLILLIIAAITGNTANYFIGKTIGTNILESPRFKWIRKIVKKEYIERTQRFYEKHGGKAIVFSRFIPILRTFAPFVAGIGKMNFTKFSLFNCTGGVAWALTFLLGGYFFGEIPVVKNNFTYVIFGIIFVSLLPAVVTAINARRKAGS